MVNEINSSVSPNGNFKKDDPFKKLSESYEDNKKDPKKYPINNLYIEQKNYLNNEPKPEYKDIIIEKIKEKEIKKPEKEEQKIIINDETPKKEISTTTIVEISKVENKITEKKHNPFEITKRTEYAFSAIFVIALFISLLNFPFTSFMNWDGVSDVTFSIGWPMKFFEVSLNKPEGNPIKFVGLIVDVSLYILLAYLIDIIAGFFIMATRKKPLELDKTYNYKKEKKIETKEHEENKNEKQSLFKRKEVLPELKNKEETKDKIEISLKQEPTKSNLLDKKDNLPELKDNKKIENTNSKENIQNNKQFEKSPQEIIDAAKKAYEHYQKKGLKEEEIIKLFKDKGWKEEDIKKLK